MSPCSGRSLAWSSTNEDAIVAAEAIVCADGLYGEPGRKLGRGAGRIGLMGQGVEGGGR